MARACAEALRLAAEENQLQIQLELGPVNILAESERLRLLMTNLLSNAIQYNRPAGQIRLQTCAENGQALLRISDTGIGIAPEDLPHIFERFYRADKSRAGTNGHAGLGLAICQAIVEADAGNITVSSQPGVGTTVTIRWLAINKPSEA